MKISCDGMKDWNKNFLSAEVQFSSMGDKILIGISDEYGCNEETVKIAAWEFEKIAKAICAMTSEEKENT